MSLLVTVVLGDVVEVFTADDDGTVHLGGDDTAGEDTTTDGNETSEGALLVCILEVSNLILTLMDQERSNSVSGYSSPESRTVISELRSVEWCCYPRYSKSRQKIFASNPRVRPCRTKCVLTFSHGPRIFSSPDPEKENHCTSAIPQS